MAEASAQPFIDRWKNSGAAERANYQLFLSELCDVLGVQRPDPTKPDDTENEYVFERSVTFHYPDGSTSTGRIDLYKRGCFILEARQPGPQALDVVEQQLLFGGQHIDVGVDRGRFVAQETSSKRPRGFGLHFQFPPLKPLVKAVHRPHDEYVTVMPRVPR